jgi:hypothetical protein
MPLTRREFLVATGLGLIVAGSDVTVARRLLFAGGGGSFPAPDDQIVSLTSAPEGGWSWFEDPRAVAHAGWTYIGYNEGGDIKVAALNGTTLVRIVTLHAALQYDDHDTPTLHVRTDGKLAAYYSAHLGSDIYQRISTTSLDTDPDLGDGFDSETSLSSSFSAAASTYPSPVPLADIDGGGPGVFLLWREHDGGVPHLWYARSDDDGDTWSGAVHLHDITYTKAAPNGTGRLDLACSEHPNGTTGDETKIYHLYRDAAAWHLSDGTTIPTGGGDLPLSGSDMTEVYDAGADPVWITDIAIDGSDNPIILFATWPSDDTDDVRHMYARWTGSVWSVSEICAGGSYVPDEQVGGNPLEVYYHGGAILDHDDPQIVYVCRETGATWELFRYVTADGGASFTETQLTSGSSSVNMRPVYVRDAGSVKVVWMYGTYHSYVNYSVGTRGLIP